MLEVYGTLRISGRKSEALVTAEGERLSVRPASLMHTAGLVRALGMARLQTVADQLHRLGITLHFHSGVGVTLILGRRVKAGLIPRLLGLRRVALARSNRSD